MLEEKAKTKWCPMVQLEGTHSSRNRMSYQDHDTFADEDNISKDEEYKCWGSACAMWCWNSGSETEGYCGLRGKVVIP